jgi:predicted transcriptional regulator
MATLESRSTHRDRTYRRSFDHELAREMRASGLSYPEIARRLGVSATAIRRVCDEKARERLASSANAAKKVACATPGCDARVSRRPGSTGLCATCYARSLTRHRPTSAGQLVIGVDAGRVVSVSTPSGPVELSSAEALRLLADFQRVVLGG